MTKLNTFSTPINVAALSCAPHKFFVNGNFWPSASAGALMSGHAPDDVTLLWRDFLVRKVTGCRANKFGFIRIL